MNYVNVSTFIGIIGGILGIISLIASFFLTYAAGVKRQYGAERDFNHLKTNYATLSKAYTELTDEIDTEFATLEKSMDAKMDDILHQIIEIKTLLFAESRQKDG